MYVTIRGAIRCLFRVCGSLAGVIVLGAEFNAELLRSRAISVGAAPDQEPFAELRETRKLRKRVQHGASAAARREIRGQEQAGRANEAGHHPRGYQ